jgi:hypothetical protein
VLLVLFAAAFLISSFMISSLKVFFVFSSCCVFVKFSREFYEFRDLNLEIESFGETHTHTSNSMIQGFCCFCFSVRQSDPGYGIFESVLICIPCTY